jgi:hypothetical protein
MAKTAPRPNKRQGTEAEEPLQKKDQTKMQTTGEAPGQGAKPHRATRRRGATGKGNDSRKRKRGQQARKASRKTEAERRGPEEEERRRTKPESKGGQNQEAGGTPAGASRSPPRPARRKGHARPTPSASRGPRRPTETNEPGAPRKARAHTNPARTHTQAHKQERAHKHRARTHRSARTQSTHA